MAEKEYPPCRNRSCKSYGKPHPNCRCHNSLQNSSEAEYFCSKPRVHLSTCEYHLPLSKPVVYLVCGVPGAGKTWVCTQLEDDFNYVPHDMNYLSIVEALKKAHDARPGVPLVTECPFGERPVSDELRAAGFEVRPYFVVESPAIVSMRYSQRENKPAPKAALTRAVSILQRVREWNAPYGTSEQVRILLAAEGIAHRKTHSK